LNSQYKIQEQRKLILII